MQDNSHNSSAPKAPRNGLRLVHGGVERDPTPSAQDDVQGLGAAAKPRRKSALVQFMTAYADSIDRDIKLLLDL
jgi:hypothetical protein